MPDEPAAPDTNVQSCPTPNAIFDSDHDDIPDELEGLDTALQVCSTPRVAGNSRSSKLSKSAKSPQLISPKKINNIEKLLTSLNCQAVSNNDKLSNMESKLNNRIDEAINHSKLLLDNISGMKQDIANQRQDTDELKVQVKTLMEEKTVLERKVANLELATTKKISVFEDMIPEAAQQPSVIDLSTNEQFHELEQNILRITESATDDKKSGNCEIERLDQILKTNTKDMDDIKTSFKEFSDTILLSLESINPSARPKST